MKRLKNILIKIVELLGFSLIKWVSIEERLPEVKEGVAIQLTVCNKVNITIAVVQAVYFEGRFFSIESWNTGDLFEFKGVKFWSMLPMLPKAYRTRK